MLGLPIKKIIVGSTLIVFCAYMAQLLQRRHKLIKDPVGAIRSVHTSHPKMHFLVVGDTGSGDHNQYQVAAAMEKRCQALGGIDGILLLGDNFYSKGVTSIDDPQWEEKVWKPYGSECLSRATIYPILGNHDYKQNPSAQVEYSRVNPRWHMPHRFYRVDFGHLIRVVAFDSSYPDLCFSKNHCSVDFLRDALLAPEADQAKRWTIVLSHHPLSSASSYGHGYRGGLFGMLMRPMVCGRADAWFSGHSHHLEHRELEGCSTDLFVVGGGGGDLYQINQDEQDSRFARSTFGFLDLKVTETELSSTFFNQDGVKLYNTSRRSPDSSFSQS